MPRLSSPRLPKPGAVISPAGSGNADTDIEQAKSTCSGEASGTGGPQGAVGEDSPKLVRVTSSRGRGSRTSPHSMPPNLSPRAALEMQHQDSLMKRAVSTGSSDAGSFVPGRNTSWDMVAILESNFTEQTSRGGWWEELNHVTFQDKRWENAGFYVQGESEDASSGEARAREVLRRGAKSFGLWYISDRALEPLVRQLLGHEATVSAPLKAWISEFGALASTGETAPSNSLQLKRLRFGAVLLAGHMKMTRELTLKQADVREYVKRSGPNTGLRRTKLVVLAVWLAISLLIVVPKGPSLAVETFGWPLVVARMTGVGTLLGTSILFLSMSRTLLRLLYQSCGGVRIIYYLLDEHTTIHAFVGKAILALGVIHTFAHLHSTYDGIRHAPPDVLDLALDCSDHLKWAWDRALLVVLPFMHLSPCPVERNYGFWDVALLTPLVTGLVLFLILSLMAYSHRHARKYEHFWTIHNWGMWLWLLFLYFHGLQDWFGIGVPLVLPVCTVPALLYGLDRILRLLRFYLFKGRVSIVSAVIRPGPDGGPRNAMTYLEISKPPFLWRLQDGMYAYLCIPEISRWQWHPFTVCSCKEDETVHFIIQGVGDWTQALAKQCLDLRKGIRSVPPDVVLDGPFAAPVMAAFGHEVLIAVGAGVGVTPFLSLMASSIAALTGSSGKVRLQELHFFWMARSADEFLFGRQHFTRIATQPGLRGRIHLHLHLTGKGPENDAPAFLFREAARRQSRVDRAAFHAAMDQEGPGAMMRMASIGSQRSTCTSFSAMPALPRHWVDHNDSDVVWVSGLIEGLNENEDTDLSEAYRDHWAEGCISRQTSGGMSSEYSAPFRKVSSARSGCEGTNSFGLFRRVVSERPGGPQSGVRSPWCQEKLLPLTFGRPDFITEIQNIGKAWGDQDIQVLACGGQVLIDSLQEVCEVCNRHARKKGQKRAQQYVLRHERFGGT